MPHRVHAPMQSMQPSCAYAQGHRIPTKPHVSQLLD